MKNLFLLLLVTVLVSFTTPEKMNVKATLYFPAVNQTDSTPYITASGRLINKEDPHLSRYIAVSGLMETKFPMGTRVRLTSQSLPELNGVYTVADRMNRRYSTTALIDILVSEKLYIYLKKSRYTSGMFIIEKI